MEIHEGLKSEFMDIYGPQREKPVFGGLGTTKAKTRLRIRAV